PAGRARLGLPERELPAAARRVGRGARRGRPAVGRLGPAARRGLGRRPGSDRPERLLGRCAHVGAGSLRTGGRADVRGRGHVGERGRRAGRVLGSVLRSWSGDVADGDGRRRRAPGDGRARRPRLGRPGRERPAVRRSAALRVACPGGVRGAAGWAARLRPLLVAAVHRRGECGGGVREPGSGEVRTLIERYESAYDMFVEDDGGGAMSANLATQTYVPESSEPGAAEVLSFLEAQAAKGRSGPGRRFVLIGSDEGEQIELPATVYQALLKVVVSLAAGKAVTVAPTEPQLTTQ